MRADGKDAATKVNPAQSGQQPNQDTKAVTATTDFKTWLESQADRFSSLMPKNTLNPERFVRAASIEISRNPKLMQCSKKSLFMALGDCARYGLEPGSMLGQAWLIPYNESYMEGGQWKKEMRCQFQLGYKGMIVLARRSETIASISAEPVYENDVKNGHFSAELGVNRILTHKPDFFSDRGGVVGYYALVKLTNGEIQFAIMSKTDVEKHRDRFSKVKQKKFNDTENKYKNKETVWDTDFDAMALKTCISKVLKLCPISVEALEAISEDERAMVNVTGTASGDAPFAGEFDGQIDEDEEDPDGDDQPSANSESKPGVEPEMKQAEKAESKPQTIGQKPVAATQATAANGAAGNGEELF